MASKMKLHDSLKTSFLFIYSFLVMIHCFENSTKRISFRNNFCSQYEKLEKQQIERTKALKGMTLSVGSGSPLPINLSRPYIANEIMREIAKRGEFNLTFHAAGIPEPNESYTDLLMRTIETYDIASSWWESRLSRLQLNIIFPEGYYDASTIMIGNLQSMNKRDVEDYNFWAFTQPFSPGLWIMVVLMVNLTGLVYYLLDYINSAVTKEEIDTNFFGSIFFSFHSFTGHCNYTAKSRPTQILTTSMCFLYLILVSGYTANLANFFVTKNYQEINIEVISDVTKNQIPLCVRRGYPISNILKEKYPNAQIIEKDSREELFSSVSLGEECVIALATMEEWKTYRRDDRYNKFCSLSWIGRRIDSTQAGFAVKDSRSHCSSLLENVLNLHMLKMKQEGVIDRLWQENRERESEATCQLGFATASDDSLISTDSSTSMSNSQLTARNMSGIFVFHVVLVIISIFVASVDFCRKPKHVKAQVQKEITSSFKSIQSKSSLFKDSATTTDISTKAIQEDSNKAEDTDHVFSIQSEFITSHKIENIKTLLQLNSSKLSKSFDYLASSLKKNFEDDKVD